MKVRDGGRVRRGCALFMCTACQVCDDVVKKGAGRVE